MNDTKKSELNLRHVVLYKAEELAKEVYLISHCHSKGQRRGQQKYNMPLFLEARACIDICSLRTMKNRNIQVDYNDSPSRIVDVQTSTIKYVQRATFLIHTRTSPDLYKFVACDLGRF